jgi:acetyl esterase/lipase
VDDAGAKAPPALLLAARSDDLVDPARNTGRLAAKLRGAGVPVREQYYGGVNHYTLVASLSSSLHALAPTLDAVEAFVKATVSGSGSDRRTSGPAR